MSPIRTLHVAHSLDRHTGGALTAPMEIARHLERSGVSAEIAASFSPGDDLSHLKEAYPEVRTHAFARSFPSRYANSREFAKWMRGSLAGYDIVEIHSVFYGIALRAAQECRRQGKPYFVRPHGSLDPFDLRKHSALKAVAGPLLIRPMLAKAAAAVLTSDLEAERMVTYGAGVRKIVLPLPVPLSEAPADPRGFRERHGIPQDAVVALFMSRIDPKKGLQMLIPAVARLRGEFGRLWLVLAGAGEPDAIESTRALLRSQPNGARVRQVGFVSGKEKLDALAAANLFCPSVPERKLWHRPYRSHARGASPPDIRRGLHPRGALPSGSGPCLPADGRIGRRSPSPDAGRGDRPRRHGREGEGAGPRALPA